MDMKSIVSLVFHLQAIINGVNLAVAQPVNPNQQVAKCKDDAGNFKSNSHQKHRDAAFEVLSNSLRSGRYTGYSTIQAGNLDKGERVYAATLCPPYVKVQECQDCIKNTGSFLSQKCPKQKVAVGYTSLVKLNCIVRYTEEEIKGKRAADWGGTVFWNPSNEVIKDVDKGLNDLAAKLTRIASEGDMSKKFASGNVIYGPDKRTLYGEMQCTPDLSKDECVRCLHNVVTAAGNVTDKGKVAGRSLLPSCYVRYSHANFLPKNLSAISTITYNKTNPTFNNNGT